MAFISSKLICWAPTVVPAHNAAGGHILDHINAMLDVVAHSLDQFVRTITDGRSGVHLIVEIGAVMVVRMTAGGGDRRTRSHQTGAPVFAAVDGVTDSLIRKTVAAYYTREVKPAIRSRCAVLRLLRVQSAMVS